MIILGGQMAQLSIFINDGLTRNEANNLWVRNINVEIPRPVYLTGEMKAVNTISNDRHIRTKRVYSSTVHKVYNSTTTIKDFNFINFVQYAEKRKKFF